SARQTIECLKSMSARGTQLCGSATVGPSCREASSRHRHTVLPSPVVSPRCQLFGIIDLLVALSRCLEAQLLKPQAISPTTPKQPVYEIAPSSERPAHHRSSSATRAWERL